MDNSIGPDGTRPRETPSRAPARGCRARGSALLGIFVAIVAGGADFARPTDLSSAPPPAYAAWPDDSLQLSGRFVYLRNCAICHGRRGDGRGEMAVGMFPRPRGFADGIFKYRSTPDGFLPTNDDLIRTIRTGLTGTSMPAFAALSPSELQAVAEYVKSFSPRWRQAASYATPLNIPPAPPWFDDPSQRAEHARHGGRTLFLAACAACHGETGSGHGPAAPELKDFWDQNSIPADLRQTTLRNGATAKDLYRTLVTGISGTPMPTFSEALSPNQLWEIVACIETLRATER